MRSRDQTVRPEPRNGFSLVELMAVLVILGLLLAIILPAVQSSREASRATGCRHHLDQFGTALQNFESVRKKIPGPDGSANTDSNQPMLARSPHVALLVADPGNVPWDPINGWQWYHGNYSGTWYNHAAVPNWEGSSCSAHPVGNEFSIYGIHPPRSQHADGVNLLAGDGAVHFVSAAVDRSVWEAYATVSGNESTSGF